MFERYTTQVIRCLSPFYWINRIPFVRRYHLSRGIADANVFISEVLNNPEFGTNSIWAGIHAGGLLVLLEFGIFNFIQLFVGQPLIRYVWDSGTSYRVLFLAALCIPPGVLNYFVLFKDDRYLAYFKKFETESPAEKRKHTWLAALTILAIWAFCIGSFAALCHWGAARIK
jgi:hypothetical protein